MKSTLQESMEETKEVKKLSEIILHFRPYSIKGVLKNNGGYTVLIVPTENKEVLKFTLSRCGKSDNFNRAIGISIARGRMKCERARLWNAGNQQYVISLLESLNTRCREKYDRAFFEKLLAKLG
jgi:hypothetical protein